MFTVIDRETDTVIGSDLSLDAAVALRDSLTTLGDPVILTERDLDAAALVECARLCLLESNRIAAAKILQNAVDFYNRP